MLRPPLLLASLLLSAPLLVACSSEANVINLDIVTGHETDAMTQDPPVDRVKVEGISPDGDPIEAEAAPGGELDFGEVDGELAYTFEVTGYDAPGNVVVRGRSLGGIVLGGVDGDTIPVFAQRLGQWARPPGELARTHTRAPAVSVGERYLFTTGGDAPENAVETEEYDLFSWAAAKGETFPFAAQTLVSFVNRLLAMGGDQARWLSDSGLEDPTPVEGLSFAEISGGSVVYGLEGRVFVVGATRPDGPTDAVLDIADDETVTVRRLVFPRAGAAAVWLQDVGLVVVGGSATGNGVEVLAEEGNKFTARVGFPPDPTAGAAAVRNQLGTITLVGGTADGMAAFTRQLDPRCTSSECAAKPLEEVTPAVALTRVSAFALHEDSPGIILLGDEAGPEGLLRTFLLDDLALTLTEVPLREPRRGATPVAAPNGTLALMGGVHPDGTDALTIEMFFP